MIKNKKDLRYFLDEDLKRYPTPPRGIIGWLLQTEKYVIWHQVRNLRKLEYYQNTATNPIRKLLYYLQMVKYFRIMRKTEIYVYPNVFGPGLYIPHLGRILTPKSDYLQAGRGCTLRPGLLVAMNNGMGNRKYRTMTFGDNVEFSEGCKILCKKIGNNVVVGPNAVVTRNVPDDMTVFAPLCEMMERDV